MQWLKKSILPKKMTIRLMRRPMIRRQPPVQIMVRMAVICQVSTSEYFTINVSSSPRQASVSMGHSGPQKPHPSIPPPCSFVRSGSISVIHQGYVENIYINWQHPLKKILNCSVVFEGLPRYQLSLQLIYLFLVWYIYHRFYHSNWREIYRAHQDYLH